jgi:ParB family chromosome partitioning protein
VKSALGKGLGALIPEKKPSGLEIVEVELARIAAGREQPRKTFRDEGLRDLAQSIREKGVIQPVILKREGDGSFSLIAGERRVRASRLAGLKKIPAIIREAEGEDALEIALIENIQREDLGAIETAHALDRLQRAFGLTQEKLSEKVGMERVTIANFLRLLRLPEAVKEMVADGRLSMGHARALLAIEDERTMVAAARKAADEGMSVRECERLARKKTEARAKAETVTAPVRDPDVAALEQKLIRALGTKVRLKHKGKRGRIEIEYYSLEELDSILERLMP